MSLLTTLTKKAKSVGSAYAKKADAAWKQGTSQVKTGVSQMTKPGSTLLNRGEGALNIGAGAIKAGTSSFEPIASKILSPVNKVVDSGVDKLSNTALIKGAAGNQVSGPGGTTSYQQTNTSGLERGLAAAENAGVISGAIGTFRGVSPTKAVRPKTFAERFAEASNSSGANVQRNIGNPTGGMPRGDVTVRPPSNIRSTAPETPGNVKSGSTLPGDTAPKTMARGDVDMRNSAPKSPRADANMKGPDPMKPKPDTSPTPKLNISPTPKRPILRNTIIGSGLGIGALAATKGGSTPEANQSLLPKGFSADSGAGVSPDGFEGGAFEAGGPAPAVSSAFGTGGSLAPSGGAGGGFGGGFGGPASLSPFTTQNQGINAADELDDETKKLLETLSGGEGKWRYENKERRAAREAEKQSRRELNDSYGGVENRRAYDNLVKQENDVQKQIAEMMARQQMQEVDLENFAGSMAGANANRGFLDQQTRRSLIPLQTSLGLIQSQRKRFDDLKATADENAKRDGFTLGEDQIRYEVDPETGKYVEVGRGIPGTESATDSPSSVREYEYAVSQGYTGTYDQFKGIGGAGGGDKVLTPTEAASLGVPYGTTQAQAYGTMPDKLSGDAAKVNAIVTTIVPEINMLKKAFEQNYRGSLAGILTGTNRELVKLVDQIADKVGRLRSGGAVNKDEEERFKRQIASFMDLPFGDSTQAIQALDGLLSEANQVSSRLTPQAQYGGGTGGGGGTWDW